jgi:Effector protein
VAQTVEYWRPAAGYHAGLPGIAVLTNDTAWNVLDDASGMYMPAAFPPTFRADVDNALSWINHTPTGAVVLHGIVGGGHNVDITPTSLGNNVQSVQPNPALNAVALELLTGNPGGAVQVALNGTPTPAHAQPRWLHRIITRTPLWTLDSTPGVGGGWLATIQSAREWVNTWLLWSQANEGYFSDQTLVDTVGVQAFATTITLPDVTAWLAGNPLAARLTNQEREHAVLATIAALAGTSGAGGGSDAHVRWNPGPTNPLNATRPPAIGLGHELLHAYFSSLGMQCGRDDGHFSTVLFEYRCVGLGPWDEVSPSENLLRREWSSHAIQHIPLADPQNRKVPPKRIRYN